MRKYRHSDGRIFCYALERDVGVKEEKAQNEEEIMPLLARQLQLACDGWTFFGTRTDRAANLIQAYTHEDEKRGWYNQMREMVVTGVWAKLAAMRVPRNYQWIVKVDSDTFVRPSTLRAAFARLGSNHKGIISVSDGHNVASGAVGIEGFFLAVPTNMFADLRSYTTMNNACDSLITGHSEARAGSNAPGLKLECYQRFGKPASFLDEHGLALVASDGEGVPTPAGLIEIQVLENGNSDKDDDDSENDDGCAALDLRLIHHKENIAQAARGHHGGVNSSYCGCKFAGRGQRVCLSENFVALHPVDSRESYEALARAYP
jgi:hypothetical protein